MKSYQETVSDLSNILENGELEYKDSIIIGDNSSGKSDVLKKILENDKKDQFYFIDAVNRYFNIEQIMPIKEEKIIYSNDIKKYRLDVDKFNFDDSFYYCGTPRSIEDFYLNFQGEIEALMSEFLDVSFSIQQGDLGRKVYVSGREVDLSSGYQALLRIFIEVIYYWHTKNYGVIVIDEIDEFLSVVNSGRIYTFLRQKFPDLNFIVTTHSADLIANAEKTNLILLKNQTFEILDAGDFTSISQVYDIFKSLYEKKEGSEKEQNDNILRRLFNNKIAGIWSSEEQDILDDLKLRALTRAQKVIINQIEEWKCW